MTIEPTIVNERDSAIIAAVGRYSRSRTLVQGCALMVLFLTASPLASPRLPQNNLAQDDIARELAGKIAASVGTTRPVHLMSRREDGAERELQVAIERQVADTLTARSVRVVDRPQGAAIVTIACSKNLRDRVCAADIRKDAVSDIVMATRPLETAAAPGRDSPLALELRPLIFQRTQILDVAAVGDRLVVLDPSALTLYQRAGDGWQALRSQPIVSSRVWPRDLRGRLQVEGTAMEVSLPGMTCRASVDPLTLTCADEHQPWPVGIENTGVMAGRNYLTTPEGLAFFGSAALFHETGEGDDAGARWLLVTQDGRLLLADAERRRIETAAGTGGDIAGINISPACGPGAYAILSSPAGEHADTLRLFRVIARRLAPAASPVTLPGPLTALWAAPGASVATAVARDLATGWYEAFQVDVSCGR